MINTRLYSFEDLELCGPVVKISGVTQPEHAILASVCGADMVGLVFSPGKRQVSPESARLIAQALRCEGEQALLVGVFANEEPDRIREVADYVGLDIVQLDGDEPYAHVLRCAQYRPVFKTMRFSPGATYAEAHERLREYKALGLGRIQLLLDNRHGSSHNGNNCAASWTLAARLAADEELMLAGDLNPGNLAEALQSVSPWGVDASGGVERDGVFDHELVREFIEIARFPRISIEESLPQVMEELTGLRVHLEHLKAG